MAQAQQHDGGDAVDTGGDGGSTAGRQGAVALQRGFNQVLSQHAHQRVAAVQLGQVQRQRLGAAVGHQALVGQAQAQGFGQVLRV